MGTTRQWRKHLKAEIGGCGTAGAVSEVSFHLEMVGFYWRPGRMEPTLDCKARQDRQEVRQERQKARQKRQDRQENFGRRQEGLAESRPESPPVLADRVERARGPKRNMRRR